MSLKLAKVARASAPAKAAKANDLPNPTCPPWYVVYAADPRVLGALGALGGMRASRCTHVV